MADERFRNLEREAATGDIPARLQLLRLRAQSGLDDEDPLVGTQIDGCILERRLALGERSAVYLALHPGVEEEMCLKLLRPDLAGEEDTVERFLREAQATAQLNHPGIVTIWNVGQEGALYFIRLELLPGRTLESMDAPLDWREAADLARQVALALDHVHEQGLVHRQVTPSHIMVGGAGQARLIDFGLAVHVGQTARAYGPARFLATEENSLKPLDGRTDIYSLGVSLYFLLTGVWPFDGETLQELFLEQFFSTPASPTSHDPTVPRELCDVVRRCLQKKRMKRFQRAADLAGALEPLLA